MTVSSLLQDYMKEGTHASRPASPAVGTNGIAIYYETDTGNTFLWDSTGAAWVQVNTGGSSSSTTATFDGTTSTVATVTAFAGAAAVVSSVATGDVYLVNAVLKKDTSQHTRLILTKTKNATDGYFFQYQTDGNIICSTTSVTVRSSGTSVIANQTGWVNIRFRIGFTASAGYNFFDFPAAGNVQEDNTLDFVGSNIWIAAAVSAAGNIGKVTISKIS